jgi:inorganic triphosphatase YgiF
MLIQMQKEIEIKFRRGQVAEMSLDDVLFVRNGKQASYFGIEVELKEFGNEGDLKAISKGLMERFPELAPDAEAKFEKGMRLLV